MTTKRALKTTKPYVRVCVCERELRKFKCKKNKEQCKNYSSNGTAVLAASAQ
jgi:hypothetical protein